MKTKVLPRTTVCVRFPIKVPIWNGKNRCVGLKVEKLGDHNHITIGYTRKSDGEQVYPDDYYFAGSKRKDYPVKKYSFGDMLVVPIMDLELLVRGEDDGSLEAWLARPGYAHNLDELNAQK